MAFIHAKWTNISIIYVVGSERVCVRERVCIVTKWEKIAFENSISKFSPMKFHGELYFYTSKAKTVERRASLQKLQVTASSTKLDDSLWVLLLLIFIFLRSVAFSFHFFYVNFTKIENSSLASYSTIFPVLFCFVCSFHFFRFGAIAFVMRKKDRKMLKHLTQIVASEAFVSFLCVCAVVRMCVWQKFSIMILIPI